MPLATTAHGDNQKFFPASMGYRVIKKFSLFESWKKIVSKHFELKIFVTEFTDVPLWRKENKKTANKILNQQHKIYSKDSW